MYRQYLALLVTLSALFCVQASVLMPFGVDIGDKLIDVYPICENVVLGFELEYSTATFNNADICRYGQLTMREDAFKYYFLSVHNIKVVAGRSDGNIFYRSTQNKDDLSKISAAINSAFENASFAANQALVVTWDRIRDAETDQLNSFQAVFAKSQAETYLIYNYGECQTPPPPWVKCSFPVNESSLYNITGCPTGSNVDQPGRFIYRVKSPDTLVPYGATTDDKKMPSEENGCFELDLNFEFKYLSTFFNSTLICKSGSFSMNGSDEIVYEFSGHNLSVVEGEGNGEVYYRSTSKIRDLSRLNAIVNNAIPSATFAGYKALIVTWEKIRNENTSELNTFQMILVTDGADTFLIYNYGDCDTRPVTCTYPSTPTTTDEFPSCPVSSNIGVPQRYLLQVAFAPTTTSTTYTTSISSATSSTKQTTTKPNNEASGVIGVSSLICLGVFAAFASAFALYDY